MNNPTKEEQSSGVLFGNYQVLAKLATGGMAELFLAKQRGLAGISKTVVIKCVLPHLASSDDFVQMFLDEARVATHLQHPNIVQIFEVGQVRNVYYIAMEYIRGLDLKRIRKQVYSLKEFQEAPPFNLFAGIISQAAAGLHYAHCATDEMGSPLGIIHRDVSPNNLLISFNGVVKIVDFGVAKAATQEHRTRAGMLKGRLSYMSPEQISGQPVKPSSDIFSLGIVLYEMCTNRRLFKRENEAETVQSVLKTPIAPPEKYHPTIHPEFSRIIMKCMEREESKRYQTAEELRLDLELYMQSTEHYSPHKISEFLDRHFSEDKKQSSTGVLANPFNQADLQYLAYRTGQFGNAPTGSHPNHPGVLERNNTSASFSDIGADSSFGYFTRDESGVKGVVFEPNAKSRTFFWVFLLLLIGIGAGLAVAQWEQINRWLSNAPPPQPPAPRIDLAKRKKLQAEHQAKINDFLVSRSFQKARAYLADLHNSPDAAILGSWLKDTQQSVELESSLASVELFYGQKNYDDALTLLKRLLMEHSGSDQVREWYQKVQKAKENAGKEPIANAKPPERREDAEEPSSRRRRRWRRRPPPKRRKTKTKVAKVEPAETTPPVRPEPPAVVEKGTVFINSTPNGRVELDGRLIGYTPINGQKIKVGHYRLTVRRPGYLTSSRSIVVSANTPVELNIPLEAIQIPRATPPRPAPTVRTEPEPRPTSDEPKAKMAFSNIRLPRQKNLRLLITDPRGLVANQYTDEHADLCRKIEDEAERVLGPSFSVKGITLAWQKFVRQQATEQTTQSMRFYPRAAAYVIYNNLTRGRDRSRVAQLLVLYQRKNRFRQFANK